LSAALILGRCRRRVLVVDANEPRNHASGCLHGYLTQDGVDPWALRERGCSDVAKYPSVTFLRAKVADVHRGESGFTVITDDGVKERSRLLLLATGRIDPLPKIPGFREAYGKWVYHC